LRLPCRIVTSPIRPLRGGRRMPKHWLRCRQLRRKPG
jgi:hypothetical protein